MRKTLFIGSCLLVCTLFSNLNAASLPDADWDVLSRKFTYYSLTGYELSLFEGFIASEFPAGKTVSQILTDQASLRNETRLKSSQSFIDLSYVKGF